MPNHVSIIIASRNEGPMLKQTVEFIRRAPTRLPYEIVMVDDGSTDDSFAWMCASQDPRLRLTRTEGLGIAPARNQGASLATGDILVFCDAHIDVEPYWLDEFVRVMDAFGADAVTPAFQNLDHGNPLYRRMLLMGAASSAVVNHTMCGRTFNKLSSLAWMPRREVPFETPVLSGGCWAIRAEVFRTVGGYEEAFRGYGGDEEEISLKLWLGGYTLYATPLTCVAHQFRFSPPYKLQISDFLHNRMYTALCHFKDARVQRLLEEQRFPALARAAYEEVFTPKNIEKIRLNRFARRARDDDWYFSHFGLNL